MIVQTAESFKYFLFWGFCILFQIDLNHSYICPEPSVPMTLSWIELKFVYDFTVKKNLYVLIVSLYIYMTTLNHRLHPTTTSLTSTGSEWSLSCPTTMWPAPAWHTFMTCTATHGPLTACTVWCHSRTALSSSTLCWSTRCSCGSCSQAWVWCASIPDAPSRKLPCGSR